LINSLFFSGKWRHFKDLNDDNVDFQGCVCSAIAFVIMSWAIHMKGPLYVSVFSPLLLVIVAISSWALLGEKLYVGT
jgi:uncharacterized membrane protein